MYTTRAFVITIMVRNSMVTPLFKYILLYFLKTFLGFELFGSIICAEV
jgi:hypothetical protein